MNELKKGDAVVKIPTAEELIIGFPLPDAIGEALHDWTEWSDGDRIRIKWLDGSITVEDGSYKLQKLEDWGDQSW